MASSTYVPANVEPTDPRTRALIHVHRALGLECETIATRLDTTTAAVEWALADTRDRVADGADPLDVYADVLAPVVLIAPEEVSPDGE